MFLFAFYHIDTCTECHPGIKELLKDSNIIYPMFLKCGIPSHNHVGSDLKIFEVHIKIEPKRIKITNDSRRKLVRLL